MATATAAQRALGVPELAEAILINVDTKTLLFAQRVCTAWRQIIQESKPLQQALFFQPTEVSDIVYKRYNPESRNYFEFDGSWVDEKTETKAKKLIGNPLARRNLKLTANTEETEALAGFSIQIGYRLVEIKTHSKWLQPGASFRRMLVCQPAIKKVCVEVFPEDPVWQVIYVEPYSIDVTASNEGVTLGDIFDALIAQQKDEPDHDINAGIEGTEESSWGWVD